MGSGPRMGEKLVLPDRVCTLGRGEGNTIQVRDSQLASVSRVHCIFEFSDGRWHMREIVMRFGAVCSSSAIRWNFHSGGSSRVPCGRSRDARLVGAFLCSRLLRGAPRGGSAAEEAGQTSTLSNTRG